MTTVYYSSSYIPPELIEACGATPCRVSAFTPAREGVTEGMCVYARSYRQTVSEAAEGIILFSTECDQLRRSFDFPNQLPNSHILNIPSTWQTPNAFAMYESELRRLVRILTEATGCQFSESSLADMMVTYDSARDQLRRCAGYLPADEYNRLLLKFVTSRCGIPRTGNVPAKSGLPLALVGGPLTEMDNVLMELVKSLGGDILVNAAENGELSLPRRFDRRAVHTSPWLELLESYFFSVADIRRRPNSLFYSMLKERLDACDVKGIIVRRFPWCDLWHAELSRLRDWLDIPILDVDAEMFGDARHHPRLITRLEAFMETISD